MTTLKVFFYIHNSTVLSVTATSSCSNLLVTRSSSSGIIFSNRNEVYSSGMNCQWTLSSNKNLKLVFFRFETESGYDFVYVYDGGSSSSPLIGKFHGSSLPGAITSSRNKLFVRFTTDGSKQESGFAASYHGRGHLKKCATPAFKFGVRFRTEVSAFKLIPRSRNSQFT